MKRLHVNVGVVDLERSVAFYTHLFGAAPSVAKPDYARWLLDDPRVNFAISTRSAAGVDHVGIQTDCETELAALRDRLAAAETALFDQPDVVCCYARSRKTWAHDPDGLAWETFLTRGDADSYGDPAKSAAGAACCGAPAGTAEKPATCC